MANFSSFMKGLAAAVLTGAVSSITDAQTHKPLSGDVGHIGTVAAIGGAAGLLTFLVGHVHGHDAGVKSVTDKVEVAKGEDTGKVVDSQSESDLTSEGVGKHDGK